MPAIVPIRAKRRGGQVIGGDAEQFGHQRADGVGIFGELDHRQPRVELDVVEAITGALAHPLQLLVDAVGGPVARRVAIDLARQDRRVQPDDVGGRAGETQHALGAATDEDGRTTRST